MAITVIRGITAIASGISGSGSGTVASAASGQVAYYPADGSIVQGNPSFKFNDTSGVLNLGLVGDSNSLAIGASAMNAQASAANIFNIAIGRDAMANVNAQAAGSPSNVAINNVAIGYKALQNAGGSGNTDGTSNVAIGRLAMGTTATVSGNNNVFIGDAAGQVMTGGNGNVGIGSTAMGSATTASANTCIGQQAGGGITTGDYNTIMGYQSGGGLQSGTGNILLGVDSSLTVAAGATHLCIIKGTGTAVVSATNLNTTPIINFGGPIIVPGNITTNAAVSALTLNVGTSGGLEFSTVVSGQGASTATLTNSPVAGNPSFYIPVRINGVIRFIPAW